MCDMSHIFEKKHEPKIILFLLVVAFIPRVLAVIFMLDSAGDGPFRAMIAYSWSKYPYISTHGVWLPGFMYLSGVFNFIVNDPLISTRILNLIIGTITIPVFYFLVRRVFNHEIALFSTSVLAFLPLHIGLSAGSLSEVSFIFLVLISLVLFIEALEVNRVRLIYLFISLLLACFALTMRYEAWLLIPLLPIYHYWKIRKVWTGILIAIVLGIFPGFWMMSNYLHGGIFLPIIPGATTLAVAGAGAHETDLAGAIWNIGSISISHIGWILVILILWGVILQCVQAVRGRVTAERVLYLSIVCIFWIFILCLAIARGSALWHRYLLFGFVMALPFAAMPLVHHSVNYRRWLGAYIIIAIFSIMFTYFLGVKDIIRHPIDYVTHRQPSEIKRLAEWLRTSSYRSDHILLTRMTWESTYLPLYFPEMCSSCKYAVAPWAFNFISFWTADSSLDDFLKVQRPAVLVTRDYDHDLQSRIETILGKKINENSMVHTEDGIKVYDIRSLLRIQSE
jgi:hypothetical protein